MRNTRRRPEIMAVVLQLLVMLVVPSMINAQVCNPTVSIANCTLPPPPAPQSPNGGSLVHVTDGPRGLWMDGGTQWFGIGGEVANVKDFGARGDLSVDDQPAIQAAIDALGSTGGIVEIPPGFYRIDSTLIISAASKSPKFTSVWLRGSGVRTTQLLWNGDDLTAFIETSGSDRAGSINHKISDLTLNLVSLDAPAPRYGLYLTGAPNGGATGVTNSRFERLNVFRMQTGIQIGDRHNPNVAENFFYEVQVNNSTSSGIVVQGNLTGNIHFVNCAVAYTGTWPAQSTGCATGLPNGSGWGVEILGGASADFFNMAWNGKNGRANLHMDTVGPAGPINIIGGHAEVCSQFLYTDVESGGNVNKAPVNLIGVTLGAGSCWVRGSSILTYNSSGQLGFYGSRVNLNGNICVMNPSAYPNPTVINVGTALDGGAVFSLQDRVYYSRLEPSVSGGNLPRAITNIPQQINSNTLGTPPLTIGQGTAGQTIDIPIQANSNANASISFESTVSGNIRKRWQFMRDTNDDFFLNRFTDPSSVENLIRIRTSNGHIGIKTAALGIPPAAVLHVNGSIATGIVNTSGNYLLSDTDHTVLANVPSGGLTITLPLASGSKGRMYMIKKIDPTSNQLIILRSGSDLIDGAFSSLVSTTPYQVVILQSDGSGWWRLTN